MTDQLTFSLPDPPASVPTLTTDERWVRYVANEHPGVFVEHANPEHPVGFGWAAYRKPEKSEHWPNSDHGWSIDICFHARGFFLVDCIRTLTDKRRTQFVMTRLVETYDEAKRLALAWLDDPELVPPRYSGLSVEYHDEGPDSWGRRRFTLDWVEHSGDYREQPHPKDGKPIGYRRGQLFHAVPEDVLARFHRQSLSDALALVGYTHAPGSRNGERDIIDTATGEVVFTGRAWDVWAWLKEQNNGN